MLVLGREFGQSVTIYTDNGPIVVKVCGRRGTKGIRLGFEAPKDVKIIRSELIEEEDDADAN
jgi:carbon storage regulator CsrA